MDQWIEWTNLDSISQYLLTCINQLICSLRCVYILLLGLSGARTLQQFDSDSYILSDLEEEKFDPPAPHSRLRYLNSYSKFILFQSLNVHHRFSELSCNTSIETPAQISIAHSLHGAKDSFYELEPGNCEDIHSPSAPGLRVWR